MLLFAEINKKTYVKTATALVVLRSANGATKSQRMMEIFVSDHHN
jgi:hypothetical protein